MITLERDRVPLTPIQAYGLDTLLDLARLLPVATRPPRLPALLLADAGSPHSDATLIEAPPSIGENTVTITTATLGALGRFAGAAAEQQSMARDRHGRVPASENPLVQAGRWQHPLISLAAQQLRTAVLAAAPDRAALRFPAPWPNGRRWSVALTHDLDLVAGWGLATTLRVAELLRHGAPALATGALRAAIASVGRSPVEAAIARLLERLAHAGVRGTWFVLCGTPSLGSWRRGDLTYLTESVRVRRLLQQLREAGHEVGLHGSFATQLDAERMTAQRARLEAVIERPVQGVRQHFLRMRPGATQRVMLEAGFQYDSTYGFADRSGYRLAAADVVPAWDELAQRVLPLTEVPLHWMDRTLSKYAGDESPVSWVRDGLARAAEVQAVEGVWTGLWHPNLSAPLGFPGAEDAFQVLLDELRARQPYFGTVGELVDWRAARRAVHVAHLRPDGGAVFAGPTSVPIEDAAGQIAQVERVAA